MDFKFRKYKITPSKSAIKLRALAAARISQEASLHTTPPTPSSAPRADPLQPRQLDRLQLVSPSSPTRRQLVSPSSPLRALRSVVSPPHLQLHPGIENKGKLVGALCSYTYLTTGFTGFAECRLHSAKTSLHSANFLPSVTLGKASYGKGIFAECRISGTRQRLCREPWHSAKQPRGATLGRHFAECLTADTQTLPSVGVWHSAKCPPRVAPRCCFAECWILALGKLSNFCRVPESSTRQSGPGWRHVAALPSAKALIKVFSECAKSDTRQRSLCRGRLCRV